MNLELRNSGKEGAAGLWVFVAWVAGLFCAAICATLLFLHATATENDPWKSPQLLKLHAALDAAPKDAQIKTEIRKLDLQYRQRFFRRLHMDDIGGWLLLGGVAVFLLAAHRSRAVRTVLPVPAWSPANPEVALRLTARARWAVAGFGAVVFLGFTAVAFKAPIGAIPAVAKTTGLPSENNAQSLPNPVSKPDKNVAPAADLPSLAEFRANWPRFRGPDGSGFSPGASAPTAWDETGKKGVLWKSEIPLPGLNSPVVWGNRVFISGGTREKRAVFCYDVADGKLVWQRAIENVPGSPAKPPEVFEQTGFAASTMATDGRRVYVIFANGDLAAIGFDGEVVWAKNLGFPNNQYGHATSLAVWEGRLIVQMDQSEGSSAGSRLTAFDGATGKVIWEKKRKVPDSWASPIVVEAAGKVQIITAALPSVIAYDFNTGAELWNADVLEGDVAPSPILAGGLICIPSPSGKIYAIRPDGSGDVTKNHVAWTGEENVPDVTSPASNGELLFYVTTGGMMTCLDVKDGSKQWEHDFGTEIQASPGIAGNRVYVVATDGHAWVVEAGREFKEIGNGALDDKFFASPAFVGGRIYLRGDISLYCIGEK